MKTELYFVLFPVIVAENTASCSISDSVCRPCYQLWKGSPVFHAGSLWKGLSLLVLCNWSDDSDTVSDIAILDTAAISEMRHASVSHYSTVSDNRW